MSEREALGRPTLPERRQAPRVPMRPEVACLSEAAQVHVTALSLVDSGLQHRIGKDASWRQMMAGQD